MTKRALVWQEAGDFFEWTPPASMGAGGPLRIFHGEFGDPDAPLVVLLHGFPTSSIDWFDIVRPLTDWYRVAVLDFPGFGFSDKPAGANYTLRQDAQLVSFYLEEILGADRGVVVAHDRGDSVALAFLELCSTGSSSFGIEKLVLSNANLFLPLSFLTDFQRQMLDAATAPQLVERLTPERLAAGMGASMFTPPRTMEDPAIEGLAETFATNDGLAVMHDTIQYLVERSENEVAWLELLGRSPVPTTMIWGLYDTVSPLRVAQHVWQHYRAMTGEGHSFWLLPLANHYLQDDQPAEFAAVVSLAVSGEIPDAPGPLSAAPGAPVLLDRSRSALPSARDVLAGP